MNSNHKNLKSSSSSPNRSSSLSTWSAPRPPAADDDDEAGGALGEDSAGADAGAADAAVGAATAAGFSGATPADALNSDIRKDGDGSVRICRLVVAEFFQREGGKASSRAVMREREAKVSHFSSFPLSPFS